MAESPLADRAPSPENTHQYVVVARRYRPQVFGELLGQEHVARALSNAIATGRVGHAYLFTGARGVGKTSAARILAKSLDCQKGVSAQPCNECDICRSITAGSDVDVLEIDGASNRGIDEIRQLRQNVNVRPSRARFKIYIIDEVHMLTREAFNALLKTLEEPPEHVKFIFCTTEATKIPITILSRCQRFDFAGIDTPAIGERLKQICQAEGVEAESEAIDTIARRAAGSMRDSQSLLEQILAFSSAKITLADVNHLLGTASDEYLAGLVGHLIDRNPAAALAELDVAVGQGIDAGQLLEQLLGYLRDCLVIAAGGSEKALLYCTAAGRESVTAAAKRWGLATLLAAMQIVDQTLSRMRYSTQGRILAELAVVRISQLEDLEELAGLVQRIESMPNDTGVAVAASVARAGSPALEAAAKKNIEPNAPLPVNRPAEPAPAARAEVEADLALNSESAVRVWRAAVARLSGMVVGYANEFSRIDFFAPNRLVVTFAPGLAMAKAFCQRAEQVARFERALSEVAGARVRVEFALDESAPVVDTPAARPPSPQQRMKEVLANPMVRRATELFGAQPTRVDGPAPTRNS